MFTYRWDETSKHSFVFKNGGLVDVIDNESGRVLCKDVRYRLTRVFETEEANIAEFLHPLRLGESTCGGVVIRGKGAFEEIRRMLEG